jgi:uncharacterized protein
VPPRYYRRHMRTAQIALFPLGTVLMPGALLPLHIFEPRYRTLVDDLVARTQDPSGELPVGFGVVAIRVGRETGVEGVRALHSVGTFAALRHVQRHEDGRFDIVVEGRGRFRPTHLDPTSRPYLQSRVEWIDETPGAGADRLASSVAALFRRYRLMLGQRDAPLDGSEEAAPWSPGQADRHPNRLSYDVAANTVLNLADQQSLLEASDDAARLRMEQALLRRELALWQALPSLPDVGAARVPIGLN